MGSRVDASAAGRARGDRRLVLVAPTAGVAGPASASESGSIGLRLVDVPAAAADDPRAQLYIVDHLNPGSVIQRRVEVSNTTAETAHVDLYAAAATIEQGTFLAADGHTANEASRWTSVTPRALDVPAGGAAMATVTIDVPPDAAPGEQYAVAWAQMRTDGAMGGVAQFSRVGLRLYLSVGSGGAPAADFALESVTAARTPDGQPAVLASVVNTGGRALDLHGDLRLTNGPGELIAGPFPASQGTTLAVGDSEQVRFALAETLPAGPWDARITLRSGLLERDAEATLAFPDSGAAAAVLVDTGAARWWGAAAVAGVALVLLAFALVVVLRRRGTLSSAPHCPAVPSEAR